MTSLNVFIFFGLYWGSNFATRGSRTKGVKPLFSHRNFVQLLLPIRKNKFKKEFRLFWAGIFITLLPYFKLIKIAQKIRLNSVFHRVFFNFPRYLLVQSVPKYLGLFKHVATFQFTICYNLSYYSFFSEK